MRFLMVVLGVLLAVSCSPSARTGEGPDADAVRAVLTDMSAAVAANDGARAAAHYLTDGAMYRARAIMIGSEIVVHYEGIAQAPEGSIEFVAPIASVSASRDMAYVSAVYQERGVNEDGRATYEEGDVLMVLLKEDGVWRVHRDARSPTVQALR